MPYFRLVDGVEVEVSEGEALAQANALIAMASLPSLSARQFFHGLWKYGLISYEEVRSAVKNGDIPAAMMVLIQSPEFAAQLPDTLTVEDVIVLVEGAQTYEFTHPVTVAIGGLYWEDPEQFRAFWNFCATL